VLIASDEIAICAPPRAHHEATQREVPTDPQAA